MLPSQSLIFTLSVTLESCPYETFLKHFSLVELGKLANVSSVRTSHLILLYNDCRQKKLTEVASAGFKLPEIKL